MDFGAGRAEEFFDQAVAAAELHLFGEDAQGGFRGDELDLADADVGSQSAKHFSGEDRTTGAGDGEDEAEVGRGGFGRASHEGDYRLNCRVVRRLKVFWGGLSAIGYQPSEKLSLRRLRHCWGRGRETSRSREQLVWRACGRGRTWRGRLRRPPSLQQPTLQEPRTPTSLDRSTEHPPCSQPAFDSEMGQGQRKTKSIVTRISALARTFRQVSGSTHCLTGYSPAPRGWVYLFRVRCGR